jgi:signal transduction histidine kinase
LVLGVETDRSRGGCTDETRLYDGAVAAGLAWGKRTSRKSRLVVADCVASALICTGALVPLASLRTSAPKVLVIAVAVAASTTVAWRRAAPYRATFVALVMLVAYQRLTRQAITDVPPFALVLTTYTASTLGISRRQISRLVCLLALSSAAVVLVASNSPGFSMATVVEAALPAVVAPAAAGLLVAWRRSVARRLRLTRALLEDEQELRVARAATDERHRLAQELHDVVAHAVSVMVIHAGVARLTILDDPTAAAVPLGRIITSGREALVDLRRMIGPVWHDDQKESGSPPTISRLGELVQ